VLLHKRRDLSLPRRECRSRGTLPIHSRSLSMGTSTWHTGGQPWRSQFYFAVNVSYFLINQFIAYMAAIWQPRRKILRHIFYIPDGPGAHDQSYTNTTAREHGVSLRPRFGSKWAATELASSWTSCRIIRRYLIWRHGQPLQLRYLSGQDRCLRVVLHQLPNWHGSLPRLLQLHCDKVPSLTVKS
jgi:hypothetical protein